MYDFETARNSQAKRHNMKEKTEMKTKTPIEMKMDVFLVTPSMARAWLEKNVCNRAISRLTVNRYANDMKTGKWVVTPHGIVFDSDGNLLDGQHRLTAVVESGCSVRMTVITGVDANSKWFLDIGKKRNGSAMADMLGIKNSRDVSSVVQKVGEILTGSKTKRELPNDVMKEILGIIGHEISDVIPEIASYCKAGSVKKNSTLTAIYWLCKIHYGEEKTSHVFSRIIAGYNLTPKSKEAIVRKKVILAPYVPGDKTDPGEGDLMRMMRAIMPLMANGNTVEAATVGFRSRFHLLGLVNLYEDGFRRSGDIYNALPRKTAHK